MQIETRSQTVLMISAQLKILRLLAQSVTIFAPAGSDIQVHEALIMRPCEFLLRDLKALTSGAYDECAQERSVNAAAAGAMPGSAPKE